MTSYIDFLTSGGGGYLYPITLTSAIYDLEGNTLDNILVGKANSDHNHDYLPLSGGTMTGNLQINKGIPEIQMHIPNISAYGRIMKNASTDADYGTYLSDYANDGAYVQLSLAANSQTIQLIKKTAEASNAGFYDVIHSGNYSSYALPLSGGTLTGRLSILPGVDWSQIVMGGADGVAKYKVHGYKSGTTTTMYLEASSDGTNNNRALLNLAYNEGTTPKISISNYIEGAASYYTLYGDHNKSLLPTNHYHQMMYGGYKTNPIASTTEDTNTNWSPLNCCHVWISKTGLLLDQPNQWMHIVQWNASVNGTELFQLGKVAPNGDLYHRGCNSNTFVTGNNFRKIWDNKNSNGTIIQSGTPSDTSMLWAY